MADLVSRPLAATELVARLPGGGGPDPWLPTDIADLLFDFDAADTSTITADGSNVVQNWVSSGGSSPIEFNFETGDPSSGTRTFNDLNVIDFDGNDAIQSDITQPNASQTDFTFALVGQFDSGNGIIMTAGLTLGVYIGFNANWSGRTVNSQSTSDIPNTTAAVVVFVQSGTDLTLYVNGQAFTGGSGTPGASRILLGAGGSTGFAGTDGWVGRFIGTDSAISDEDRLNLEGFLADQWGLSASLPANHPGRSGAPTAGGFPPPPPPTLATTNGWITQQSGSIVTSVLTPTYAGEPTVTLGAASDPVFEVKGRSVFLTTDAPTSARLVLNVDGDTIDETITFGAPTTDPAQMRAFGGGLGPVRNFQQDRIFIDLMKTAGVSGKKWDTFGGSPTNEQIAAVLGPNGFPKSFPADVTGMITYLVENRDFESLYGDYVIFYDSPVGIRLRGTGFDAGTDFPAGRDVSGTATYTYGGGTNWFLQLLSEPNSIEPKVAVVRQEDAAAYKAKIDAGAEIGSITDLRPDAIDLLSRFSTLRMMDVMETNDSTFTTLADYPPETAMDWSDGVPFTVQIDICNATNTNMWVNIPHLFTDAAILEMANLISANLNAGLRVYVEFSNEHWNDQFDQSTAFKLETTDPSFPSVWTPNPAWDGLSLNEREGRNYGYRASQAMVIMQSVLGSRAEGVLGVQTANSDTVGWAISGVDQYVSDNPGVTVGGLFAHISPTGYTDGYFSNTSTMADDIRARVAAVGVDAAVQEYEDQMHTGVGPFTGSERNLIETRANIAAIRDAAQARGIQGVVLYEWNTHLQYDRNGTDADVLAFMNAFLGSQAHGNQLFEAAAAYQQVGVTEAALFTVTGVRSPIAVWGVWENIAEKSPLTETVSRALSVLPDETRKTALLAA